VSLGTTLARTETARVEPLPDKAPAEPQAPLAALHPPPLTSGRVSVDTRARRTIAQGVETDFTPREFDLLAYLMAHAGEAFTKDQLMRRVWGCDVGDTSTVTVHIRRLRENAAPTDDGDRCSRLARCS
jgi:DNA-binding response OmpR family regulator